MLESWENPIVSISSGNIESKMDNINSILILEKMRRNSMIFFSQDALHVRERSKEKGHQVDKKRDNSKGGSKTLEKIKVLELCQMRECEGV